MNPNKAGTITMHKKIALFITLLFIILRTSI